MEGEVRLDHAQGRPCLRRPAGLAALGTPEISRASRCLGPAKDGLSRRSWLPVAPLPISTDAPAEPRRSTEAINHPMAMKHRGKVYIHSQADQPARAGQCQPRRKQSATPFL